MRNIIKIGTVYSRLNTDDEQLKRDLWSALRFRDKGYFHSRLYKQKKWDGFVNFFSLKAGQFLTGLLPEIRVALKTWDKPYEIEDHRAQFNYLTNKVDE